jgi:hypothetical protein
MGLVLAENFAAEHEDVGQPMSGCPWRAAIKPDRRYYNGTWGCGRH